MGLFPYPDEEYIMSKGIEISFPLLGIVAMVLFMLIMMGVCFIIMRIFSRRMCGMDEYCGCKGMICNRKEEHEL